MWPFKKSLALLFLSTFFISVHAFAKKGGEVSIQVQGLGPNAGGVPVLGGRVRIQNWEGSVHYFSADGLTATGSWRGLRKEKRFLTTSLNLSVRRTFSNFLAGPGLTLALTTFKMGPGYIGLRLDNDFFYSFNSQNFETEYLLGFTYLIPGGTTR
jgi:hypothetical protein